MRDSTSGNCFGGEWGGSRFAGIEVAKAGLLAVNFRYEVVLTSEEVVQVCWRFDV